MRRDGVVARGLGRGAFLAGSVAFGGRGIAFHEGGVALDERGVTLADDLVAFTPDPVALFDGQVALGLRDLAQTLRLVAVCLRLETMTLRLVALGFDERDEFECRFEFRTARIELGRQRCDFGRVFAGAGVELRGSGLGHFQIAAEVVAFTRGLFEAFLEPADLGVDRFEFAENASAIGADTLPLRLLVCERRLELGHATVRGVEFGAHGVALARVLFDCELEAPGATGRGGEVLFALAQRVFAVRERRFELRDPGARALEFGFALRQRLGASPQLFIAGEKGFVASE